MKKNFFKIRETHKVPYEIRMKTNFFTRQAIAKILFVLHSNYTGNTPYRVWFDLDNSLTRWKSSIFKIRFSLKSQNSVWNTKFFLHKL